MALFEREKIWLGRGDRDNFIEYKVDGGYRFVNSNVTIGGIGAYTGSAVETKTVDEGVMHVDVFGGSTLTMSAVPGLVTVVQSGTGTSTVTLSSGTWDGTNTIATFDAADEKLTVAFDAALSGIVITNTGTVALS